MKVKSFVFKVLVISCSVLAVFLLSWPQKQSETLFLSNVEALSQTGENSTNKYLYYKSKYEPTNEIIAFGEDGEPLDTGYAVIKHYVECYNPSPNGTHICMNEGSEMHTEKFNEQKREFECPFAWAYK